MFSETVGPLLYKPNHMKNIVNAMTVIVPISNMPNSVSRVTEPAACNCIHLTIFTFSHVFVYDNTTNQIRNV